MNNKVKNYSRSSDHQDNSNDDAVPTLEIPKIDGSDLSIKFDSNTVIVGGSGTGKSLLGKYILRSSLIEPEIFNKVYLISPNRITAFTKNLNQTDAEFQHCKNYLNRLDGVNFEFYELLQLLKKCMRISAFP